MRGGPAWYWIRLDWLKGATLVSSAGFGQIECWPDDGASEDHQSQEDPSSG